MKDLSESELDPALDEALRPPTPGRLVRLLAAVAPGVATTRDQITAHAHHWRTHAEAALQTDGDDDATMVVLGDSLSQAVGASSVEESWVHRLAVHESTGRRGRPARIVNLSRSGARVDDVIRVQLPAMEAIGRPVQLVTCTVGSNDLARGGSFSKVERSMHSLMSHLPSGAILATLPAKGSLMAKRLNKTIRAEAGRSDLVVADVDAHLPGWRGRSAGDRFHPNDLGYEAWFDAFAEVADQPGAEKSGDPPVRINRR
jgi:lysophospholipase L1-like esterase